jgi:hypothetical protein
VGRDEDDIDVCMLGGRRDGRWDDRDIGSERVLSGKWKRHHGPHKCILLVFSRPGGLSVFISINLAINWREDACEMLSRNVCVCDGGGGRGGDSLQSERRLGMGEVCWEGKKGAFREGGLSLRRVSFSSGVCMYVVTCFERRRDPGLYIRSKQPCTRRQRLMREIHSPLRATGTGHTVRTGCYLPRNQEGPARPDLSCLVIECPFCLRAKHVSLSEVSTRDLDALRYFLFILAFVCLSFWAPFGASKGGSYLLSDHRASWTGQRE